MIRFYHQILFLFFATFLLASCAQTALVADNEFLVDKVKVEQLDGNNLSASKLESYVKQKPNRKVAFAFRFHLRVYNLFHRNTYKQKCETCLSDFDNFKENYESDKEMGQKVRGRRFKRCFSDFGNCLKTNRCKVRRWLIETIGEPPVIYNHSSTNRSIRQMEIYLNSKGYFNPDILVQLELKSKDSTKITEQGQVPHHIQDIRRSHRDKKLTVKYLVEANQPSIVKNLAYNISDVTIDTLYRKHLNESYLSQGMHFDVSRLRDERDRVTRLLRNEGFYKFSRDYVNYVADTTFSKKPEVNLKLEVQPLIIKKNEGEYVQRFEKNHERFKIRNVYIHTDYDPKEALQNRKAYNKYNDTIPYKGYHFIVHNQSPAGTDQFNPYATLNYLHVRPNKLLNEIYINKDAEENPDSLYRLSDVEQTYQHLTALKVFQLVNLEFTEPFANMPKNNKVAPMSKNQLLPLDCDILLTPAKTQSYTVELEGSNFSSNFGMAGNFIYNHRNFFRTATNLNIKLKGARERRIDVADYESGKFNTQEYGVEGRLVLPQLYPAFVGAESTRNLKKLYNPKTTFWLSYNYRQRSDYTRDNISFSYGYYWRKGKKFTHYLNPVEISSVKIFDISADFIQRLNENPWLRDSYEDHLITVTNYSMVYSTAPSDDRIGSFPYFKFSIESSGNLLNGIHRLTDKALNESGSYTLFNKIYTQYLKGDFDWRYYNNFSKHNTFVYRGFIGVAYPYGNVDAMPFGKKYFSGGANSLRAWNVRSLGPGGYTDVTSAIPNQTGDVKLESNIEFRSKLFWMFESALFLDAGNIWDLKNSDLSEANFAFSTFLPQIAVGTGFGLRLDFSFFILRADIGIKLRDPSLPAGERWLSLIRSYSADDFNLNIGIGYPF